jgi:CDP-diacylglycerol--glycerol-3-phosphate 3-phosphatidyltransferase
MNPPTPTERTPTTHETLTDRLRVQTASIIDPIVTFLAHAGVHPNTLTIMGMVAHLLPAWLITQGQPRWAALALAVFVPLDALDGSLSRKLGLAQGGFGAFLDSMLDRLAEIILYAGFLLYYSQAGDLRLMLVTYVGITGSIMVSYARARAESLQVSCKVGMLSRVERYLVVTFFLALGLPEVALVIIAVLSYVTVAQRLLHVRRQFAEKERRSRSDKEMVGE